MIHYRAAQPTDIPFVIDSWAQSFYGAPAVKYVWRDDYFKGMHRLIVGLLARKGARLTVASPEGDDETVLGWACREGDVLHYAFVRPQHKEDVSLDTLLGDGISVFTHRSRAFSPKPHWRYTPFRAWLQDSD